MTFMLLMIALLIGEGTKYANDSLGSLKSSFSFLCVTSTVFSLLKWTHKSYLLIHPGKYCGGKMMKISSSDKEFILHHRDHGNCLVYSIIFTESAWLLRFYTCTVQESWIDFTDLNHKWVFQLEYELWMNSPLVQLWTPVAFFLVN